MQQIKLFKGIESEIPKLESQINAFLEEHQASVIHLTGNIAAQTHTENKQALGTGISPSDVLIVLVYETSAK